MFVDEINKINLDRWVNISLKKTLNDVKSALYANSIGLNHLASLLSPAAEGSLEEIAYRSREITLKRFGKNIQLYAPVYLSNYCTNSCLYCGFNRGSKINRKIQTFEAVEKEAGYLKEMGFRSILLVSGDDPNVNIEYLSEIISRLHTFIPSISLEIAPKTIDEYKVLMNSGAEGVVVYQETYEKSLYDYFHPSGRKSDYNYRIETPDRISKAGFYRIGIGVLLGLGDPIYEGLALFTHAKYLLKHFWKNQLTISLPRLRKAIGAIEPSIPVSDKKFTQLICALRIALPDVGILLSTREEPKIRDNLIKLGITQISAGSKTEPGGYLSPDKKGEQFSIEDRRTPKNIAGQLRKTGYEPIWKDWEVTLNDSF